MSPLMLSECFSTSQVLALTGATARQLQWWDEHSLVVPARRGRRRLYSASDLAEILVILELRQRRISLQQVRRVLRFLKQELHVRLADLLTNEADRPLPEYHLLIDGNRLYLETDSRQIFDLLRSTTQAVFLISLSPAVKKLQLAGFTLARPERPPAKKPAKRDRQSTLTAKGGGKISA
jgi:DNA-binding transcriptional MerR regulator